MCVCVCANVGWGGGGVLMCRLPYCMPLDHWTLVNPIRICVAKHKKPWATTKLYSGAYLDNVGAQPKADFRSAIPSDFAWRNNKSRGRLSYTAVLKALTLTTSAPKADSRLALLMPSLPWGTHSSNRISGEPSSITCMYVGSHVAQGGTEQRHTKHT